jgi:hypothetical protein
MLKVDFWKSLSLQSAVAPIRRSVVVFLRSDETPHVARRGHISGSARIALRGSKLFRAASTSAFVRIEPFQNLRREVRTALLKVTSSPVVWEPIDSSGREQASTCNVDAARNQKHCDPVTHRWPLAENRNGQDRGYRGGQGRER